MSPDIVVRGLDECEHAELLDIYAATLAELRERNSNESDGGPPIDDALPSPATNANTNANGGDE